MTWTYYYAPGAGGGDMVVMKRCRSASMSAAVVNQMWCSFLWLAVRCLRMVFSWASMLSKALFRSSVLSAR